MTRFLPALSVLLTGRNPQPDFADLSARAIHAPRPTGTGTPALRAGLSNLRAAIRR